MVGLCASDDATIAYYAALGFGDLETSSCVAYPECYPTDDISGFSQTGTNSLFIDDDGSSYSYSYGSDGGYAYGNSGDADGAYGNSGDADDFLAELELDSECLEATLATYFICVMEEESCWGDDAMDDDDDDGAGPASCADVAAAFPEVCALEPACDACAADEVAMNECMFATVADAYGCDGTWDCDAVGARAAQGSEIPNFKGSDLGHFPLVSADFWTSDHLSERSRSVDAHSGTRARGTLTLKRR